MAAAALNHLGEQGRVTAVELYEQEAGKIDRLGDARARVIVGDFFAWFATSGADASFDAVLGNPPFIRYQAFEEAFREPAFALMREVGLHPTRLTNAWLPFVVVATRALRDGGRLALVLPAELLQVGYAAELREYLSRTYRELTVVTFRTLVFERILQETVLLLGVRGNAGAARIAFVELDSLNGLSQQRIRDATKVAVDLDHAREKWIQYYLTPDELALVREVERAPQFGRLGELASIDVGVVTGRNEFFVLSRSDAKAAELLAHCLPLVGRSAQTPGLVLRAKEWEDLATRDGRCYLLQLGDTDRDDLPSPARRYVELGERDGVHQGYKCRIRLPRWWSVPSAWTPDAFLLRQIYDGPRIILNQANATSTDTIHRVRALGQTDPAWLAAASMNSLTFAFAEIRGRSYGGGVLELEPTEAEGLPLPRPDGTTLPLDDLDAWARRRGVEATLAEVDRLVLRPSGLSDGEITSLRAIWRKLCQRRMSRRRR